MKKLFKEATIEVIDFDTDIVTASGDDEVIVTLPGDDVPPWTGEFD